MIIAPGSIVPDFSLARGDGEPFTQEDLRGQTTVLVFYPFAFSGTCTNQLQLYDERKADFGDAVLYGVSCDATYSQTAFAEHLGVSIEQLSDFEPKGEVSRAFGAYFDPAGMSNRCLVVVNPDLTVGWSFEGENPGVLPTADDVLEGLAEARSAAAA